MCRWLIAVYGKNYADFDLVDVASEVVQEVIIRHEICGFTAETFKATLYGNHMGMLRYTKFVLQRVSKVFNLSSSSL
jgi:hypothetical protein